MHKLPLDGIRVLDFTAVWAGPHVTQWLAVMGADVIKLETTLRPDGTRRSFTTADSETISMSAVFAVLNYSKKGITLNMNMPKAIDIAKEIVKVSDVVTENFGGPVMDRWGLGYSDLVKIKPDIIMYSGSGFGRTGPYKELPAYAGIIEAFTGLCSLNSYVNGEPLPLATRGYSDLTVAEHGALAILAALYHRSSTGEGQHIDLSMTEVMATYIPETILDYTMNNRFQPPEGNRDIAMAPHGCYRCRGDDEWVAIAVASDAEWKALCGVMGNPRWSTDEKFSDGFNRLKYRDELDTHIQEWTKNYGHYEVTEILQRAGVMAGPSAKVEEVMRDRQLEERGFYVTLPHPGIGDIRLPRLPWNLNDKSQGNYVHAPYLGEHNDYVFKQLLKMSDDEISRLQEENVIV